MQKGLGLCVAACAIVLAGPAADGAAPASEAARGELIVNFTYTESYTRKYGHNDEHGATTENMSFHGTVKRPYSVTIADGQLVDFSEMSPDEAKKNAAQPSGNGSLQYNATDTTTGKGFSIIAKKQFNGTFGNDSVSATLIPGDNGVMTVRSEIRARNILGACSFQSKTSNSTDCTAVPLASMGPSIDPDSAQSAKFDWSSDVSTGAEPSDTVHSPDPTVNYLMGIPAFGLQTMTSAGGNRTYTFHKTVQFEKTDAASGARVAKQTLDIQAMLRVREVKCALTDAMVKSAFSALSGEQAGSVPLGQLQTRAAGGDAIGFTFSEPAMPGQNQGFTVSGTAALSGEDYRVSASLTPTGTKTPGKPANESGSGCDFDLAKSAGLNAAFLEAIYPLIENYLSGAQSEKL
jgi:hypothetical protein